ncbi:hypothetical protein RR46_01672 [Papilio xuthus]|uniref:Uncharacterized protein n=1 Tax=Papilio xuthus TaxID=66420 RepID=A0A0N1IEB9_PAPXU|nr:hypothetical protein RR46_01672 [Papilio xuthus]
MIIKAPTDRHGQITTEFITLPAPKPSTIITATPVTETPVITDPQPVKVSSSNPEPPRIVEALTRTGAYVNIHDAEGVSLSPTKDDTAGKNHICSKPPSPKSTREPKPETNELNSNADIIPFIPNFQTPGILKSKCQQDFNKLGSNKVAEVMRMFTGRNANETNGDPINSSNDVTKSHTNKVKRSDSYKLANSPLMPIKKLLKLDSFGNGAKKVNSFEMIQAEIAADLLREEINYPSTVSPKLGQKNIFENLSTCECNVNDSFPVRSFESQLSALTLSPLTTPLPKRQSIAFVPNTRDTALDMLTAILDSSPDDICILHTPPSYISPSSKVTVPVDGSMHRARILSISESEYGTEIW